MKQIAQVAAWSTEAQNMVKNCRAGSDGYN